MATASVNGVDLYYETFGDPSDPPVLLVCGLGMQLVSWSPEWFEALVAEHYWVIAYDNRDVGLSSHLDGAGVPDLGSLLVGQGPPVPYTLTDMSDDAARLLDHLGVPAAHVVGISMGGMIAQRFVIDHPERVLSLCSIMSTTGNPGVGQPREEALAALFGPPPSSREEAEDAAVEVWKILGSPGFPFDEARERRLAGAAYDRANYPAGIARQTAAIVVQEDRTAALAGVRVPTVVIHGLVDPLVQASGGEATAAAIPGARLLAIEGMGHSMPMGVWPQVIAAIGENIRSATGESPAVTA